MRMREERTAFERLYRGHQLAVYRYALRRVGERAVDDVVAELLTHADRLQPISTATGKAGRPITVVPQPTAMAITPNGKTLYVASANFNRSKGWVTPISVAAASG